MAELKRKHTGRIGLKASFIIDEMTKQEEEVQMYCYIDKDVFLGLSEDKRNQAIGEAAKSVSLQPGPSMKSMHVEFSYENKDILKEFNYANILIEATIPYCLHVPSSHEFEVKYSSNPELHALVFPFKIWTNKAVGDSKASSSTDFFAENRALYYKDMVLTTRHYPVTPEEGWEQQFTGTNLQKNKERDGTYRYSSLYIQFELPVSNKNLDDSSLFGILLDKINVTSLTIVNKLIDSYRYESEQEYVTRLGALNINSVHFLDLNRSFYLIKSDGTSATMNIANSKIKKIDEDLEKGISPELYSLLLLDAKNSFDIKNYPLAVVQSYQALDIYVERILSQKLIKDKSYTESQAEKYLTQGDYWKTKVRLGAVLKSLYGFSVHEKDSPLWNAWLDLYKNLRNEVIHKGKEATSREVEDALSVNEKVIKLIELNRF